MSWKTFELENEWKRLVDSHVGEYTSGEDGPTVRVYWQMVEHHSSCEICRDEETIRELDRILGKPQA